MLASFFNTDTSKKTYRGNLIDSVPIILSIRKMVFSLKHFIIAAKTCLWIQARLPGSSKNLQRFKLGFVVSFQVSIKVTQTHKDFWISDKIFLVCMFKRTFTKLFHKNSLEPILLSLYILKARYQNLRKTRW